MHADRSGPDERLRTARWRQAERIQSLEDTIAVLRAGANALAIENLELRTEIDCLQASETRPLWSAAADGTSRASRVGRAPRVRRR